MNLDTSPIAAIATAPGRGGIGVVRISGKSLDGLAAALFGPDRANLRPRHATYLPFLDAAGCQIDQGIALHFPAPHSYTGEDVLELQGHGGPLVLQLLLERCLEAAGGLGLGLRLAEPGEFTRRAFLNGKLDLAQAEAVADLIDAATGAAARSAAQSLSGVFSKAVHGLVEQVVRLRMLVEATLDFPEEEIDFLEQSDARGQLAAIETALGQVLTQAAEGALLRQGLNVVLVGQPNVGKSSLLNALAGAEVAIVTPIAGTTRDKVCETIQIEGVPLNIIDTAGIRAEGEALDQVERIGIGRTWDEVGKADVILHLLDADLGPSATDERIAADFPPDVPLLRVWNKIDLSGHKPALDRLPDADNIYLSALERVGVELLRAELLRIGGWRQTGETRYIARERHLTALKSARQHLRQAAGHAGRDSQALDLFAEELRLTQDQLSSITGEFSSDDLLGAIFSHFCIGK